MIRRCTLPTQSKTVHNSLTTLSQLPSFLDSCDGRGIQKSVKFPPSLIASVASSHGGTKTEVWWYNGTSLPAKRWTIIIIQEGLFKSTAD